MLWAIHFFTKSKQFRCFTKERERELHLEGFPLCQAHAKDVIKHKPWKTGKVEKMAMEHHKTRITQTHLCIQYIYIYILDSE